MPGVMTVEGSSVTRAASTCSRTASNPWAIARSLKSLGSFERSANCGTASLAPIAFAAAVALETPGFGGLTVHRSLSAAMIISARIKSSYAQATSSRFPLFIAQMTACPSPGESKRRWVTLTSYQRSVRFISRIKKQHAARRLLSLFFPPSSMNCKE